MTKISVCTCSNKYQDDKYGKQQRVFNMTQKKSGYDHIYRCTVCLKERVVK